MYYNFTFMFCRHVQRRASASTLMLEQEEKFKEDQKRELHSVNTGTILLLLSQSESESVFSNTFSQISLSSVSN